MVTNTVKVVMGGGASLNWYIITIPDTNHVRKSTQKTTPIHRWMSIVHLRIAIPVLDIVHVHASTDRCCHFLQFSPPIVKVRPPRIVSGAAA